MENEDQKNKSLVKKADALVKFDPQKKKELIVRGLKETDSDLNSVKTGDAAYYYDLGVDYCRGIAKI